MKNDQTSSIENLFIHFCKYRFRSDLFSECNFVHCRVCLENLYIMYSFVFKLLRCFKSYLIFRNIFKLRFIARFITYSYFVVFVKLSRCMLFARIIDVQWIGSVSLRPLYWQRLGLVEMRKRYKLFLSYSIALKHMQKNNCFS